MTAVPSESDLIALAACAIFTAISTAMVPLLMLYSILLEIIALPLLMRYRKERRICNRYDTSNGHQYSTGITTGSAPNVAVTAISIFGHVSVVNENIFVNLVRNTIANVVQYPTSGKIQVWALEPLAISGW